MSDMNKARIILDTVCQAFDELEYKYDRDDEKLRVEIGIQGDDLPMKFIFRIDADRELVSLYSFLPCKADEAKRMDLALATTFVNYKLANGTFDYDLSDGSIIFRLVESFRGDDTVLSKEIFKYMLLVSSSTVDEYNDKFFMMCKNMLSFEDFIKSGSEE